MTDFDDIMDDLFHGCAFAAYIEEAAKAGGIPCPELTRRRAFQYFEESLAVKNSQLIAPRTHSDASVDEPHNVLADEEYTTVAGHYGE